MSLSLSLFKHITRGLLTFSFTSHFMQWGLCTFKAVPPAWASTELLWLLGMGSRGQAQPPLVYQVCPEFWTGHLEDTGSWLSRPGALGVNMHVTQALVLLWPTTWWLKQFKEGTVCFSSRFRVSGPVSGPVMKWNMMAARACEGGISSWGKGGSRERGTQKRPGQDAVPRDCPQSPVPVL